ncbi:hypothetical protein A6F59_16710 [Prescottella equi]|nr:hypothetical protein A6F59_16710 [Prescottella equi]
MPGIAKKAVLDLAQKKFYVDGEEFPWFIDADGPTLNNLCSPDTLRSVTLTFFVEDVEVIPEEGEDATDTQVPAYREPCDAAEIVKRVNLRNGSGVIRSGF